MNFLYINFVVVLWITAITIFLLGIFVWLRKRHSTVNKCFALYCFSISWWSFSEIWGISCDNKPIALLWTRIEQIGVFFIPTFFVHFIISLLNIKDKKWLLRSAYFFSVTAAFFCFTPFMMADSVPISAAPYVKRFGVPGLAYHFAILFFLILIAYGLTELFKAYRASTGARRNQLKYLFFSTLIGYLGGGANFLLVYNLSMPILNPFGTYALPVYIAVVTYAIVKYRLMDIRVAALRTIVFILVYIPILVTPFFVGIIFRGFLEDIFKMNWWMLPALGSSILAPLGLYVYFNIKNKAEALFLKEQRRYQHTLLRLSKGMTFIKELDRLLNLIVRIVARTVQIKEASLYLIDKEKTGYHLKATKRKGGIPDAPLFIRSDALIQSLTSHKAPIVIEELKLALRQDRIKNESAIQSLEDLTDKLKAEVAIPSFVQKELIAILLLGEKPSAQMYTQDDLNVFAILANQAALAIENARFHEEAIEKLAKEFEDLRLKSLSRMGSDMSDKVNNRLNVISMAAGMGRMLISSESQNPEPTQESLKALNDKLIDCLKKIEDNSTRGGEIARMIMRFGKPENFQIKEVDVPEVIGNVLKILETYFEKDLIHIKTSIPQNPPLILIDTLVFEAILIDLLSNTQDAHKNKKDQILREKLPPDPHYIPEITLSLDPHPKEKSLLIEIKDNGIGMTEAQMNQLFLPYFTTKSSTFKGKGLGLGIIRQMLEYMKGKIDAESHYGLGTTITLTLPTV